MIVITTIMDDYSNNGNESETYDDNYYGKCVLWEQHLVIDRGDNIG